MWSKKWSKGAAVSELEKQERWNREQKLEILEVV